MRAISIQSAVPTKRIDTPVRVIPSANVSGIR